MADSGSASPAKSPVCCDEETQLLPSRQNGGGDSAHSQTTVDVRRDNVTRSSAKHVNIDSKGDGAEAGGGGAEEPKKKKGGCCSIM